MKKLRPIFFAIFFSALFFSCAAQAETARELSAQCTFSADYNQRARYYPRSGDYARYWQSGPSGTLKVTLPEGETCQGVMLSYFAESAPLLIKEPLPGGGGSLLAEYDLPYMTNYIPFDHPVSAFTISPASGRQLQLNSIKVLSEGSIPAWVQRWETLEQDAELMLIVTHPDDELLWFGGLLPVYAGEYRRRVQVVYMATGQRSERLNELLDGLWLCGVRYYPDLGYLNDRKAEHVSLGKYSLSQCRAVAMLRKYRPMVVVTQDVNGEYGHQKHIAAVDNVVKAVMLYAGECDYDPESAVQFGVFTPQKFYLHLYPFNRITMNWQKPLAAFKGETGVSVAKRAFKMHVSQQTGRYHISLSNRLSAAEFGLMYSAVGPDIKKNDFLENCLP